MSVFTSCPDVQTLQRFALGCMTPTEVEGLAEHVGQCDICVQTLHTLKMDDTLVEVMAAQSTLADRARPKNMEALIQRLKKLRPPQAVSETGSPPSPTIDIDPRAEIGPDPDAPS